MELLLPAVLGNYEEQTNKPTKTDGYEGSYGSFLYKPNKVNKQHKTTKD